MVGKAAGSIGGALALAFALVTTVLAQTVPPPGTGAVNGVTIPPGGSFAPSAPAPATGGFVPRSPAAAAPAAAPVSLAPQAAPGTGESPMSAPPAAAVAPATPSGAREVPLAAGARPTADNRQVTRVTRGAGTLATDAGQTWQEYDITPYTSLQAGAGNTEPQRAVVDWILRDTGTDLWFRSPMGLLHADRSAVRVYHTPEVQGVVQAMIDRFNANAAAQLSFQLRLITIGNPNWRVKAQRMLRPVEVKTPGVEAWLITREESAFLLAEARKRNDFRETGAPSVVLANGQLATVETGRTQTYVKSFGVGAGGLPQPESAEIQEGFRLELNPLLSLDKRTLEAVIRCEALQIERLSPVTIDFASPGGPVQRLQVQVPQTSSWKLHERFRWPADQLLLISVGLVPTPVPEKRSVLGLSNPFDLSAPRAEALVAVEYRGLANETLPPAPEARSAAAPAEIGRRRY